MFSEVTIELAKRQAIEITNIMRDCEYEEIRQCLEEFIERGYEVYTGLRRACFIGSDFVLKVDTTSYTDCEREVKNYSLAKDANLDCYFAECDFLCEYSGVKFYIMEKCKVNSEASEEKIMDTFSNKIEAGYEADDLTPHLVAFGKDREEFHKLIDFLDDNDINDLHTGNIGVNSNGRYVFTDYAGY